MKNETIKIREVFTVTDLSECVALQKRVFNLPDLEISPVRHLIVTKSAGGFTLGAYTDEKLAGFVLSVPMFDGAKRAFYSHMMAVDFEFQNRGIGAQLKWAQREKALRENVSLIRWTFQPVQARNAFFNLEKLGVEIRAYKPNFYGTDYSTAHQTAGINGLDSDRLYADWHLENEKVITLSKHENFSETGAIVRTIEIPNNWNDLIKNDAKKAVEEQTRIREEFQKAFADNLICKGFEKSETSPKYLLFSK